jgi:hypothetical protein
MRYAYKGEGERKRNVNMKSFKKEGEKIYLRERTMRDTK